MTGLDYPGYTTLVLSLSDAARNCSRDGAEAIITLKSGVQVVGELSRSEHQGAEPTTAHLKTERRGWATVLVSEIAAVAVRAKPEERRVFS